MKLDEVPTAVKKFAGKLPKFPDGRIDYHDSDEAPVLSVFVKCGNKILLLKRSDQVHTYQGKWNTVAGYLDDFKSIREKILEELREELGVMEKDIVSISVKDVYTFTDNGKTWIVHPALVELKNREMRLDWEHTEYRWITLQELKNYDTVPNLEKGLALVTR